MKALRSFTVRPTLPEPLAPLERLAMNLRWSWDERTRDLFRWVDPEPGTPTSTTPSGCLGHGGAGAAARPSPPTRPSSATSPRSTTS